MSTPIGSTDESTTEPRLAPEHGATRHQPAGGTTAKLVVAWTVVGVPLAYGVYETAKKASALFTG